VWTTPKGRRERKRVRDVGGRGRGGLVAFDDVFLGSGGVDLADELVSLVDGSSSKIEDDLRR